MSTEDTVEPLAGLLIERRIQRTSTAEVWAVDGRTTDGELRPGVGHVAIVSGDDLVHVVGGLESTYRLEIEDEEQVADMISASLNKLIGVDAFDADLIVSFFWNGRSLEFDLGPVDD